MAVASAREKTVEDILARYPHIAESVLDVDHGSLVLVNRQESLPTGRSDLVFLSGSDLWIIELKVEPGTTEHVDQVQRYVDVYEDYVADSSAADTVVPVLLAPRIPTAVADQCRANDIQSVEYDIDHVLDQFQSQMFAGLESFNLTIGLNSVASLSLIHGLIHYLGEADTAVPLSETTDHYDIIGKEESTNPAERIDRFKRSGARLNLITEKSGGMVLTERGRTYYDALDPDRLWQVTDPQAEVVIDLLYQEPFFSDLTYSLVTLLEAVFELSKNTHPVQRADLRDWYAVKIGKQNAWTAERTRTDAVRWFGSTLDELGLVSKQDTRYYLTPGGIDLLSYFNIDKGKEMIRASPR